MENKKRFMFTEPIFLAIILFSSFLMIGNVMGGNSSSEIFKEQNNLLSFFFLVVIVVPIAEEYIFRYCFPLLFAEGSREKKERMVTILGSILFAIAHNIQGFGLARVFSTLVFSIVAFRIFFKYSLFSAILYHSSFNLLVLIFNLFFQGGELQ